MVERIRMRRRLREQRRVRDAMLLDLGALVYELHRQGKRAPELLQQKAAELTGIDEDVRYLEEVLGGDPREWAAVAEPEAGTEPELDPEPEADVPPEAEPEPEPEADEAAEADPLEPAVRDGEEPRP